MLTIIPDLHASPDRLAASLAAAPGPVAFLGDFIDGGTHVGPVDDLAVLTRVRALVEAGAPAVLGNHEMNAILFHRTGSDGQPLRTHSAKNQRQHHSFLAAFGMGDPRGAVWTDWFLTLPLWHDAGGLRLIHASWSDPEIALVAERRPDGRLLPEDLPEIAADATPFAKAVKLLISGREVPLPPGFSFEDRAGHRRHDIRLSWWRGGDWRMAALSVPDRNRLPEGPLPPEAAPSPYPAAAAPVFVGHYKMEGRPRVESPNVLCLDYPETPCVYLFDGEAELRPTSLRTV